VGGHLAQHAVAGRVAVAVVDLLEPVDVGQQQREARLGVAGAAAVGARRARAGQRGVQRDVERAAVGQAGQRVLVGHLALVALGVHEPCLEELDREHQAGVRHRVAQRALEQQVVRAG
jgi:hypothetical protein